MQQRGQLGVAPVLPVDQLSNRLHDERVITGELLDKEIHSGQSTNNTGFTFDGNSQRESHPGFYERQQIGSQQQAIDMYNNTQFLGQPQNSTGARSQVDYFV